MDDRELTPEQWNELLGTIAGDRIVKILARRNLRVPELRPAVSGLTPGVEEGLEGIGLYCRRVEALSVGSVNRLLGQLRRRLPDRFFDTVNAGITQGFTAHLQYDLWYILRTRPRFAALRKAYGPERWEGLRQGILSSLTASPLVQADPFSQYEWSSQLADRLARSFFEVVVYQIAALAAECEAAESVRPRIEPFFDLCSEGNFPVGRIEDGSLDGAFLVAVA
jgi:hypothetical protein